MFYKHKEPQAKNVTYNLLNLITNKLLCSVISYILMQNMRAVKTSSTGERGMRIKLNSHPNPHQLFCLQPTIKNHMYQMLSKTCSMYLHQDPPANNEPLSLPGHPLLCSRTGQQSLSMVLHHAQFLKPSPELPEPGVSEQDFAILDSRN